MTKKTPRSEVNLIYISGGNAASKQCNKNLSGVPIRIFRITFTQVVSTAPLRVHPQSEKKNASGAPLKAFAEWRVTEWLCTLQIHNLVKFARLVAVF